MDTATPARFADLPDDCQRDHSYAPTNDAYLKELEFIKAKIMAASRGMKHDELAACKRYFRGEKVPALAEAFNLTPNTIRRYLKTDKAKRLMALMQLMDLHADGPIEGQRKAMLWRIATKSEESDPRCAISAVGELNRMVHNAELIKNGASASQSVEIIINNQALQRGPLD